MKPQELGRIVREQTPLVTTRMLLRPLRADDASAVFNYAHDPEVTRYTQWDAHRTIEDSRRFIEQTIAAYQRGENAELAIELKSDKKVIGTCGLINISADHCRGELVFAMAKENWGGGIMGEALKAMLAFGYGALQLNRIFAKVDPDNMKTILVLKRATWQFEGTLRQEVKVRGTFRDVKLYSLLKKEFATSSMAF
ncbi:MAG TPA: GNAT family protein [Terriglobales bacterium]|nr:GNAT family protein [Terriglobales bacterium]